MSTTFDEPTPTPAVDEPTLAKPNDDMMLDLDDESVAPVGCGILGRYPLISVLLFAAFGIGCGIGLSAWDYDGDTKDTLLRWIGLIGDLFIRALKCIVLPLVFINVVISVMDMMQVGKAGSIGWKTIGLYLLTTVVASILGIISIVSFKGLFEEGDFDPDTPPMVTLGCNEEGTFLSEINDNGTVVCTADYVDDEDKMFTIVDISGTFMASSSGPKNDISLSETIYNGVFTKLVTSNITGAFVEGNFAAVVVYAIVFGIALGKIYAKKNTETGAIIQFFRELDAVFIKIINWIIMITPFAVWSLITKAIGSQDDIKEAFTNVGFLVVATTVAMLAHYFIMHWGFFALITKTNPMSYMKELLPAQTMAFACASSAATIPVTLKAVRATGRVPDSLARFVIPLGATVNMDGGAIYFPCACIWLAVLNGIQPNAAHYILLVFISTIGSAGTAPVPSASLVLIITAYNTVFNTEGTPDGFSYILAIDWFMDRLRTTLNVTGDAVVAGMVASVAPIDEDSALLEDSASDELEEVEIST